MSLEREKENFSRRGGRNGDLSRLENSHEKGRFFSRAFGDITRRIDCSSSISITMPWTPSCVTTVPLIDGWNFGGKREKAGSGVGGETRKATRLTVTSNRERERGKGRAPAGLLVSNVIYLPCTGIKNLRYCATMLRRRALLPNRDLQLARAPATRGDVWRTVMDISLVLPPSPPDPPRLPANTPVIFSPFRISLYYFLPSYLAVIIRHSSNRGKSS